MCHRQNDVPPGRQAINCVERTKRALKDGIARERDYAVRRMQSKTGGFRSPDNLITFRPFNEMSAWSGISGASMNEGVPTTGLQPTGQIRTPNDFSKR